MCYFNNKSIYLNLSIQYDSEGASVGQKNILQKILIFSRLIYFRIALEIPCAPGTFSILGQASCTSCLAGKMCPNKDGTGIRDCNEGEYSTAKSMSCTSCPSGFACPNTTSDFMIECQGGLFSTGQQVSCTPCTAGQ